MSFEVEAEQCVVPPGLEAARSSDEVFPAGFDEDVRGDRIRRKGSESNAESGHLEPEVPLDLGAVALVVLQPRRGVHPGVGLAGVGGGESGGL